MSGSILGVDPNKSEVAIEFQRVARRDRGLSSSLAGKLSSTIPGRWLAWLASAMILLTSAPRRAAPPFAEDGSVGRLAGGIAHDFNNLLTVILGYSHMLPSATPSRRGPAPRRSEPPAERAARLTRQLLAFSRKQVLQPEVLDVNEARDRHRAKCCGGCIGEDIELHVALARSSADTR